jgi:hypothetical protein
MRTRGRAMTTQEIVRALLRIDYKWPQSPHGRANPAPNYPRVRTTLHALERAGRVHWTPQPQDERSIHWRLTEEA